MKNFAKSKGKRITAALLCAVMCIMSLPLSAFAFTAEEGKTVNAYYGDKYVSADGEMYYSPSTYQYIAYDSNGNESLHTQSAGNSRTKLMIKDSSGSRQIMCIESGIPYNAGGTYDSKSGTNSSYFQNLPTTAQYGIMLTSVYGWRPGKTAPISGTNEDDFSMATQVILWEYQQQLRTSPTTLKANSYGVPADTYFKGIKDRPAEKCYNWLLTQMQSHATIPSFASSKSSSATTYTLKYNQAADNYSLTLTDTNNTLSDIKFSASGITVSRSGNKSTFGETVTAVELTPEGTGYRAKTRFARFYNLPELMAMFKEVADIKTADMLDLPVPKAVYHNISVKPSEIQKQMVAELAERAEKVRNGMVDASVDNMLKITNDGRKLALDQRLINPMLPDFEGSKLNACVDAMFETWEKGKEKRLTQLFFCDLSTPKNDGNFSVYDDIRKKLIERGVPAEEIKFIHEADTETKKLELFKKVRKGDVRILMGSTQKMGAGTNVQNKLAASSDLDCPWRPSDLEQRLGRSIRQGNENLEVDIYRFVTEETFDAYLYQLVEGKQKFASQIMTSKSPVRSCEDIDETALSYAEIKMLATGNPYIKEKMDLDIQVQKLRLLKSNFLSERYALEDKIIKFYPQEIARRTDTIAGLKSDIERAKQHPKPLDDSFIGMTVKGVFYSEKADAGNAILDACQAMTSPNPVPLGEYRGFQTELSFDTFAKEYKVKLKGELGYSVSLGTDTFGNITRLDNALEGLPKRLEINEQELENVKTQFETAKVDVEKPFNQEEELKTKTARLNELNALLNVDETQGNKTNPEYTARRGDAHGRSAYGGDPRLCIGCE